MKVVWTRGRGCLELAEALGGSDSTRLHGDLVEGCIDERADFLVSKRLPAGFDLVNVAVPVDFDADKVTKVVATVAGGPHSLLAAETAVSIAGSLGVEAEMLSSPPPSTSSRSTASARCSSRSEPICRPSDRVWSSWTALASWSMISTTVPCWFLVPPVVPG
jgi:hypothetical protein